MADSDASRRHHISMGLRKAVANGLIRPIDVRPLFIAHCHEAKIAPPNAIFGEYAVLDALATLVRVYGGAIEDPKGYAAINWNNAMKHPFLRASFTSQVSRKAVKAGYIQLVMHEGGRKTDAVRITTKGVRAIGPPPYDTPEFWLPGYEPGGRWNRRRYPKSTGVATHVVSDEAVVAPPAAPQQFAAAGLDILVLQRLVLDLDARLTQSVANNDVLIQRLVDADAEITHLRGLVPEAALVATNNGRGTTVLRDALTPAEQARLDELSASLG